METELKNVRNVTISTKVCAAEKIELQQIANDNNITRSELMYDLLSAYKNYYPYIVKTSPKEEKLSAELKKITRERNKISLELENAMFRLGMERKEVTKQRFEQFKLERENSYLNEKLSEAKEESERLQEQLIEVTKRANSAKQKQFNQSAGSLFMNFISLVALGVVLKK